MMKNIAIIPARGGSVGIPDKNIVNLNGKPLIYYSLKACHNTVEIDHVVVTTDSNKIASIVGELFPKTIVVKRPASLADNMSTSEEALLHCIKEIDKQINNVENIIFVQATSPLTDSTDLSKLIETLCNHDSAAFYIDDYGFFFDFHDMTLPRIPRQGREPLKKECGNAWAFNKDGFLASKSRLFGRINLCKIEHPKEVEIDEPEDLISISCLMKRT